ncbi:hypothetical protein K438DRAFT_1779810 [Mycena galopus ATCC 62051]|nr:hypothetical protein K438DRAFT_1779810 [Mycena galopus ATCC 62051]
MTSVARLRLHKIVTCLNEAIKTLEVISKSLHTPFLEPICTITSTLVTSVLNVKRNKDDCTQMLEQIYEMLYGINSAVLSSRRDENIAQGLLALTKTLLKGCTTQLEQALEVFKISRLLSSSQTSSSSLSLLPSEPKVFHGRESEVSAIIKSFHHKTPRVAVLGTGGMGKTCLSRVVLHHPEVATRYKQHRAQLATLIGAYIGLKPGEDLTRPVVRHFLSSPPSLLILDNLETTWEPRESRGDVENFLALLTEVDHLALIITMRGGERPANVRWSHPFLEPLRPLTLNAARQTFTDIADDVHNIKDVDKILLLTDNMPLAIDLIANLVDSDGPCSVLSRWETERTSMLSDGHDKRSNLDLSISFSLSSPRMTSSPHACDLLSLLSMLPDGLSNAELLRSNLPLENILACKSTLLRTSLAYMDDQKRLKALAPIREFMQHNHFPTNHLIQPLLNYFTELLELHAKFVGTVSSPGIIARVSSNFANIRNILFNGLVAGNTDCVKVIYSTCALDQYSILTGHGPISLMDQILQVLPQPSDHVLEVHFITEVLAGWERYLVPNAGDLIERALGYMDQFSDPNLQCRFYNALADYYGHKHQTPTAGHFSRTALSLATSTGNIKQQARVLAALAMFLWRNGDYFAAQVHAYESQKLAKRCGDLFVKARALRVESLCCYVLGSYAQSLSLSKKARELLRVCGMSGGQLDYTIMSNQAEVHLVKSEYVEARDIHREILKDRSIEQDAYQHAMILLNIAQVDVQMNSSRPVVQSNIGAASVLFKSTQIGMMMIYCDIIQAALEMRDGSLSLAQTLLKKCLDFGWGKELEVVSFCLEGLGDFVCWKEMDQTASAYTVTFLVHSLKWKQRLATQKALQFLGDVFLAHADHDTAFSLFTLALNGFTQMDVHRGRADFVLRLGDIWRLRGDMLKAVEPWKTARPLFKRSSQAQQIIQVDKRLATICF